MIDFEGDPQLSFDFKMKKDLIFKDIGTIIAALFYIKYNAIKQIFHQYILNTDDFDRILYNNIKIYFRKESISSLIDKKITQIIIFANVWLQFVIKKFISEYFNNFTLKTIKEKEDYNLKSIISEVTRIYLLDRAIYELNYELNHRPKNAIIPLFTLWENLDYNYLNIQFD
ncbi:MAG: hypothetical protein GF329_14220 [Candidatus Lokiarchaeota archaeon]|nr:hypothetical protein [Candidatus Lokiarchaeota archaeon]